MTDDHTGGSPELSIPALDPEVDTLGAALAYAACGWFVGPVRKNTKNPGSVLGKDWPAQTTRDQATIAALWAGTDHGVFLHAGRSNALIFDVDKPEHVPQELRDALQEAPYQTTRPNQEGRGHYIVRMPAGRRIGNSTGTLGGSWGEVRGLNGVILVAPTVHPEGGHYQWRRTGVVGQLRAGIAARLPDANDAAEVATDKDVQTFLELNQEMRANSERLLAIVMDKHRAAMREGSRHDSTVNSLCWALRDAQAGAYPARIAVERLREAFLWAVRGEARRDGQREFQGMLRWAVAQASLDDPTERKIKIDSEKGMPRDKPEGGGESPQTGDLHAGYRYNIRTARGAPKPVPLIDGVLDAATVCMLSGKFGTYKTFVALSWAAHLASGRDWHGHGVPEAVRVLYVYSEGIAGLSSRAEAWEQRFGEVPDPDMMQFITKPVRIMENAHMSQLLREIRETSTKLVIFDTLHRCATGVAENDNKDTGVLIERISMLRDETGCSVLTLHHTGHAGQRSRGASSLEDDIDTSFVIKLQDAEAEDRSPENLRTLVHRKRKDGELLKPLGVRLELNSAGAFAEIDPFDEAMARQTKQKAFGRGSSNMKVTPTERLIALQAMAPLSLAPDASYRSIKEAFDACGLEITRDEAKDLANYRKMLMGTKGSS